MKKVFSIFLTFFLIISLCLTSYAANEKKKKKKTKQRIEFVSKDKFILVGDFYLPEEKTNKPLIVLVHSYAMNANSWIVLAEPLRRKGYNVLAMDLRGHGRSVYNEKLKFKSRYNFKNSDWQKLPLDIIYSIEYVKKTFSGVNTNNVILVGADLGANASALAGTLIKTPPSKIIMISPMFEFKGLKMPIKTTRLQNVGMMMLLAKSDKLLFDFSAKVKPLIKTYQKGGPGMQLIKSNPEAVNDIINFIGN